MTRDVVIHLSLPEHGEEQEGVGITLEARDVAPHEIVTNLLRAAESIIGNHMSEDEALAQVAEEQGADAAATLISLNARLAVYGLLGSLELTDAKGVTLEL